VGTSLDVVDAQLALSRAQVDRLTALYELDVALARLLEASGQSSRFPEYLDRAIPAEEQR
jgi:outer membrane protein TolC